MLTSTALFRNIRNFCLVASLSLTVIAGFAGPVSRAGADPISDKQAQAKQLQDDIEQTNEQLSALGEKYNGAQLRLEQTEADLAAVVAQITATQARVDATLALVNERSASVYRRTLRGQSLDSLDYSDASKLLARKHYATIQARQDDALLQQLDEQKARLAEQQAAAEKARAAADAERQQIANMKTELESTSAKQHQLLDQVTGEIAAARPAGDGAAPGRGGRDGARQARRR